jgi:hypothetical protein
MRARVVARAAVGAEPKISDQFRDIAADFRRIGSGFRTDPETIAIEKDDAAARLVRLAHDMDGGR